MLKADAVGRIPRWFGSVQPKKENDRDPKHRRDPKQPPDVKIGSRFVPRDPRHRECKRACHEEKLDAACSLAKNLKESIWKIGKGLRGMNPNYHQNRVSAQRVDVIKMSCWTSFFCHTRKHLANLTTSTNRAF